MTTVESRLPGDNAMQCYFPDTILYGGDYNPEQWPEEVWLEDMRLMKLASVNIVSINIFSWAALEPEPGRYHFATLDRIMDLLAEHGICADLATATASPPPWMSRLYPSMLPVTKEGIRLSHGSRQHYCPNSPDYQRKIAELVQHLAERYASHPALKMWHLNNEYGCHVSSCYCDNCADAFRAWLQQRYPTIEQLNVAWGTSFWSQRYSYWEDVLPPRLAPTFNNPGQSLDYWRFMSDSLLKCYRIEEDILRAATPDVPLTTNLMVGFKPVDAYNWGKYMDIVAFDMYPTNTSPVAEMGLAHDLMRSIKKGQPHIVMEQSPSQVNWQAQNPQKRPGRMRLHVMQGVAHGSNGEMFFQWRQSQAGAEKFHGSVVTHQGNEHTRIFRQIAQTGAELKKLAPEVANSSITAQVAILMDWDNWWDVEYQPGPSDKLRYHEQLELYYSAFHRLNVSIDIVQPDSDLSQYRLVLAPLLHLLRPGVAQNLEQFVAHGGTLLSTYWSGIVDQYDHVVLGGYPGELRKLLGIHVEEADFWLPEINNALVIADGPLQGTYPGALCGELINLEGAQVLGVFAEDYYANGPALTVNQFGQGQAYYLATQPDASFLHKFAQQLCAQADIVPLLSAPEGIEVTRRIRPDGRALYFLLNHTEQAQVVNLPDSIYRSLLDDRQIEGQVSIAAVDVVVLLEHSKIL